MDDETYVVTLYTNGKGRWLKRVWGVQCPETILLNDRCQGVVGHQGDHWCFRPDGSYHFRPHESDPRREHIGCGTIPPGNAKYRTPLEMSPYRFLNHHEETEITDAAEIARLERGDFRPEENVDRPCTDEEMQRLRQLGRLETDDRRWRRKRSTELKYEVKDFSAKSPTNDITVRFDADVERFSNLDTGQSATIDAPLSMQLITEAAVRLTPNIERVLDIGCGAGNNTLKLRQVYGKPFVSEYRHEVFEYIDREDSPRPVTYQLDLLRRVGFAHVELLHKNGCFAAFGAWKE